jgi:asparagine synthetase B (glutamine-hydrolysing)
VFAVGWGERAVELMERAAVRGGTGGIERVGALAVIGAETTSAAGATTERGTPEGTTPTSGPPAGAAGGRWRCWISGRLTNARELCERFGLPFSDDLPALLARAHERLGSDACELLRGTFVVVALDRERSTATIVRDHLGGRPLVHVRVGDGALFAEHERALVELLPSTPAPDRLALARWIERGSTPPGRTLFEGIRRIPPAHRVELSASAIAIAPYWRPRYGGLATGSRQAIAEQLRDAAFAAVGRAAEGACRPAVRLSGGLDSACVAAGLAARATQAAQGQGARGVGAAQAARGPRAASAGGAVALAAVFPSHPATDERELIEVTARYTGLSVELIPFDDRASILAPALEHIERWSLPPVTPNMFVWRPLMASARALGVDVMLDGEGGDELFGYAPHLFADMLRRGRLLAAWRLTRRIPEVGADADLRLRLRALRKYGVSPLLPAAVKRRRQRGRDASAPGSLLTDADAAALVELEDGASAPRLDGPMWWRALASALVDRGETLGVSSQLRRESSDERIDRRHPFLFDIDLLQTALTDPPELQFDPTRDRALLRTGLLGHIPEAVRTRHAKSFFTDLLPAGLATDGALLAQGPARADAPVRAFVRSQPLDELLRTEADLRRGRAARRLWQVGLADIWLRALERPEYPRKLLDLAVPRAP